MKDGVAEVVFKIVAAILGVFVLMFSFLVLAIKSAARQAEQKKRRDLLALKAQDLGLTFDTEQRASFAHKYGFLGKLGITDGAHKQSCINIMTGELDGNPITLFDYYYVTDSYSVWWWAPSWETHRYLSFIIVSMNSNFPELTIAKEGFFSKIAQAIGFDDIDFESHAFSQRYKVRSTDKKFAYDFCNAQMIDYLLDQPTMTIEVEKHALALSFDDQFDVAQTAAHLSHVTKLRSLMPNYLFDSR
jgi:hypothetical protein